MFLDFLMVTRLTPVTGFNPELEEEEVRGELTDRVYSVQYICVEIKTTENN